MITTRARGLANLHAGAITLFIGVFFWVYANVIYHVPFVRLSRSVNLLPYFLCMVGGVLLSSRDLTRLAARFHLLNWTDAARLAGRQTALMALLTFTMMFATQDRSISRLFLGSFLVWSWLGLTLLNARLPQLLARIMFAKGQRLPTLFIGRLSSLSRLNDWIVHKEPLGIHPVGVLSDDDPPAGEPPGGVPWLGRVAELSRMLRERDVAQLVLLEFPATDAAAREIIDQCQERGCRLLIHNNIEERTTHPLVPITEEGRHFYTLQEEPLEDPVNRLLKRGFDLAIALPVAVLVLPPLCVWVALMQRLQAPGPLFHVRQRRGMRGNTFAMLKFRSMYVDTGDEAAESRQARPDDERIFPFGRFLRRRSLDEFPQFWNVLRGEMSVVGPRPYMPMLDEEFRLQTKAYRTRHLVKPGITGLAQSMGYRGEILEKEMLSRRHSWDVHYITHWSFWLDLQISVRTLAQVLFPPKTAY
ncbi:exopolysaccharide biosynthesis polyprenyl glycosylphosphotransferase [Opitutus terrae]|uniref:Exopolysaccharide biosynthesis polyprenyl glycosylphosphotransferase n=1 Tax=Opitutus terrae (strain DSM 11246 / JCM 15787 / PB90-1) TaxID=452637 RepID=B1ZYE0_OPITP|nr:exopolysaccharide biosynthesis polyprenyl glycosylphosphotransferase [Opitutus terrae]ACB77038.1 exopolysaccharide biosynthesis polyprenyl glycosylphosphotransferase [Opitutus terrae PB90-1]